MNLLYWWLRPLSHHGWIRLNKKVKFKLKTNSTSFSWFSMCLLSFSMSLACWRSIVAVMFFKFVSAASLAALKASSLNSKSEKIHVWEQGYRGSKVGQFMNRKDLDSNQVFWKMSSFFLDLLIEIGKLNFNKMTYYSILNVKLNLCKVLCFNDLLCSY